MSGIKFGEVNWWAVLVARFAVFMLGSLWYTALFVKLWVRLNGYSEEKVKERQARRPPAGLAGDFGIRQLFVCANTRTIGGFDAGR